MSKPENKQILIDVEENEEIAQAMFEVAREFMPSLIYSLLAEGLIDLDTAKDREYLWQKILANKEKIIPEIPQYYSPYESFVDIAKYSVTSGKPEVGIILIATSVEHLLNMFYTDVLNYQGLEAEQVVQVVRNNSIENKLGWLMHLTCSYEFPEDLKKRIRTVTEIRNAIIHYKPVPVKIKDKDDGKKETWDKILDQIEKIDLDDLLVIPENLEKVLNSILYQISPNWKKAEEITDFLLRKPSSP